MKIDKIGVGVVTYNSENYFKDLYKSLPLSSIDCFVVVNGGDPYTGQYNAHWIQHNHNHYPSICRNDCVNFLINRDCEHIFIIEDDMIIKDPSIFEKYIQASKTSGIKYFTFVSTSPGAGEPFKRNPKLVLEYKNNVSISLYQNMCNEFTYHHITSFQKTGLYDTKFRDAFDIDMAYRESQQDYAPPFWWFPDITNSDFLIQNNPVAVSRLQSKNRPDGSREQLIQKQWNRFIKKHGVMVNQISIATKEQVVEKLKKISYNTFSNKK
jgi:hypothetical protein